MIQITLSFTTIAAALAALRDIPETAWAQPAVITHAASVSAEEKSVLAAEAPGKSSPASPARGPRTAKAEAPAPAAPEKTVDEPASQPAAASAVTAPPASTAAEPAIDYATLKKAVLKLNTTDAAACQAVLKTLKVPSFKDLPADRWAEALAAVNQASELVAA